MLKQAALIGVLALLLWCYGLVMAESLPWGLQILLISLVTLAAFIYRKPFQHLFAAVGYSAVGSRKSEEHLEQAVRETRKRSTAVATAAVPGTAGYRFGRWAKRESGPTTTAPSLIMADDGARPRSGRPRVGRDRRHGRRSLGRGRAPRTCLAARGQGRRQPARERAAAQPVSAVTASGVGVGRKGERRDALRSPLRRDRRRAAPGRRRFTSARRSPAGYAQRHG